MKIGTTQPKPAAIPHGPAVTPVMLDDMGCARLVWLMPPGEAAWIALTDRLPKNGAYLAVRLSVTAERVDAATAAVAKGLAVIGEKRRAGEAVPPSWVSRLADLKVEELEALWGLDDAAHAAALASPAWVEVPADQRPIPPEETSWARVSRIVAREMQQINQLHLPDELFDQWVAMDIQKPCLEVTVEEAREKGRKAIRWVTRAMHGGEVT